MRFQEFIVQEIMPSWVMWVRVFSEKGSICFIEFSEETGDLVVLINIYITPYFRLRTIYMCI